MAIIEENLARQFGVLASRNAVAIPVGRKPDDATQVAADDNTANGTVTIHTVTPTKTLYLTGYTFSGDNASGGSGLNGLFVTNASDATQYYISRIRTPDGGHHNETLSFITPLELAAGWKVKAESNAASLSVYGAIFGYEV